MRPNGMRLTRGGRANVSNQREPTWPPRPSRR
jgi:hypothetical protein